MFILIINVYVKCEDVEVKRVNPNKAIHCWTFDEIIHT